MNFKMFYSIVLQLFILVTVTYLTTGQTTNPCIQATDCGICVKSGGNCVWCKDSDFTTAESIARPRCDTLTNLVASECQNISKVDNKVMINEDEAFANNVQVKPQKVTLQLRPGKAVEFTVSVKPASDFPVDLYFLMDVSASMEDDLQNLQTLGKDIAKEIQRLTANYRLAFGAFVDKNIIPFIQPQYPEFPCPRIKNCRKLFGYIHFFDFSRDTTGFESTVASQSVSGDLDVPEGGFDGLMQTAVCEKKLKWLKKGSSRRIVVYVTDALPKIAGDAKLGGLSIPNDGKCHLQTVHLSGNTTELHYTESETMDYPSIYQLKEKLQESGIVPILAVTANVHAVYMGVAKEWKDLGVAVGILDSDSRNIVSLIRDTYSQISSTVRLIETSPSNIAVNIQVDDKTCIGNDPKDKAYLPNQCLRVKLNEKPQIDFNISVTALSCPSNPTSTDKVSIRIPGFGLVDIDVKYLCECNCSRSSELNSPRCNGKGLYECGICKCDTGRYGSSCQCDLATAEGRGNNTIINNKIPCYSNYPADNVTVCNNFGACICGKCECFKRDNQLELVTGTHCQCKNFGCPKHNEQECGGLIRGVCECEECKCNSNYIGANCDQFNCAFGIREYCTSNGLICSDNGKCICNAQQSILPRCSCDPGYTGRYCETCATQICKCKKFHDCLLCYVNDGISNTFNCSTCNQNFVKVANLSTENRCPIVLNGNCYVNFNYTIDPTTNNETIYVGNQTCISLAVTQSADPDLTAIILGTVGGIFLLGILLLLLWKLLVTLHDKTEFEKFATSQKRSQWEQDESPIYQQPSQQFDNPTFTNE